MTIHHKEYKLKMRIELFHEYTQLECFTII